MEALLTIKNMIFKRGDEVEANWLGLQIDAYRSWEEAFGDPQWPEAATEIAEYLELFALILRAGTLEAMAAVIAKEMAKDK